MDWVRFHNYKVHKTGDITDLTGRPIFVHNREDGYKGVLLSYEGKRHYHLVHRLVAELFIPNPKNLPQVHHIDSRKGNNRVSNLRWCTREDNMKCSAVDRGLCNEVCRTQQDGTMDIYYSLREAERSTKVSRVTISKCIAENKPDRFGNLWCYQNDKKSNNKIRLVSNVPR